MGGGGGRKRLCVRTHITSANAAKPEFNFGRALEALEIFDALSCYLSLIFKHFDTKWDFKNRSNFREAPVAPPLDPTLVTLCETGALVLVGASGADSGFSFGGGGAKDCAHAPHLEREARSPLRPGSRARLRALHGSS